MGEEAGVGGAFVEANFTAAEALEVGHFGVAIDVGDFVFCPVGDDEVTGGSGVCLLYTSPSPRD